MRQLSDKMQELRELKKQQPKADFRRITLGSQSAQEEKLS